MTSVTLNINLPQGVIYEPLSSKSYPTYSVGRTPNKRFYQFRIQGGKLVLLDSTIPLYNISFESIARDIRVRAANLPISFSVSNNGTKLNLTFNNDEPNNYAINIIKYSTTNINSGVSYEIFKDNITSGVPINMTLGIFPGLTIPVFAAGSNVIVAPTSILEIYNPGLITSQVDQDKNKLINTKAAFDAITKGFKDIIGENSALHTENSALDASVLLGVVGNNTIGTGLMGANETLQGAKSATTKNSPIEITQTKETNEVIIQNAYNAFTVFNCGFFGDGTNIPVTSKDVVVDEVKTNTCTADDSILSKASADKFNIDSTAKHVGISATTSTAIKGAYATFLGSSADKCTINNALLGQCADEPSKFKNKLDTAWRTFNGVITQPETFTCNYPSSATCVEKITSTACVVLGTTNKGAASAFQNDQAFPNDKDSGQDGTSGTCSVASIPIVNPTTVDQALLNITLVNNIMYQGFAKAINDNAELKAVIDTSDHTNDAVFGSVAASAFATAWNALKIAFTTGGSLATGQSAITTAADYKTAADLLWAAFNCAFFGTNSKYNIGTDGVVAAAAATSGDFNFPIVTCANAGFNNLLSCTTEGECPVNPGNGTGSSVLTAAKVIALTSGNNALNDHSILGVSAFKNAYVALNGAGSCLFAETGNGAACINGISPITVNAIKTAYDAFLINVDIAAAIAGTLATATSESSVKTAFATFYTVLTHPEEFTAASNESCQKFKLNSTGDGWENDGASSTCSAGSLTIQYYNNQGFPPSSFTTSCKSCTGTTVSVA